MNSYIVVDALQYSVPERARFEEWRLGGVSCVHVTLAIWENARDTLAVIGSWNRLFEANADLIELARTAEEIKDIAARGKTAVIYGFQNTAPLEDDLSLVQTFHDLGVRIVQLTYNIQNHVATGCWEEVDSGVSTHLGRNMVAEMNRVGMLIDTSHCSPKTTLDAIELSARPISITHANPSEYVGSDIELSKRTKSTDALKKLAERGGVVGLSMYPRMMKNGSDATLQEFTEMVAWTVDLIGIDSVGFGTDFYTGYPESIVTWWRAGRWATESPVPIRDSFTQWPSWFENPSEFPNLIAGLGKRGFSEGEIEKLVGANWLRLFDESFAPMEP